MRASSIKHNGRTVETAPVTVVDVIGAAGVAGVKDTELLLSDHSSQPPPSQVVPDPDDDDAMWNLERSLVFLTFRLKFRQTRANHLLFEKSELCRFKF